MPDNQKVAVSEKIKSRLKSSGARFWANDNIAKFIQEGEREALIDELTSKFEGVLDSLIIDRETDPNSMETARRLAKMYVWEIMAGRYEPAPKVTAFPNVGRDSYHGMLVIRAELTSMCSHHHQPVSGTAYIGVIPGDKVIGLSKYIRIAQWVAQRGTLQEELASEIAREIADATETEDVAVYIQARHGCCENRGVRAHSSLTQTTVLKGLFNTTHAKSEFFDNIKIQETTTR